MHPAKGDLPKKTAPQGCGSVLDFKKRALHHALGRNMVMVQDPVFVLNHLAVQFIDQVIDGRIEVLVRAFSKQIIAFDMNIALCSLSFVFLFLFFNREQHFHIHHLVKMPSDSV